MDLKALKALIKVLNDNGVTHFKTPELEMTLLPKVEEVKQPKADYSPQEEVLSDNPFAEFPDRELSPEELMYYSSGGKPENSPFEK